MAELKSSDEGLVSKHTPGFSGDLTSRAATSATAPSSRAGGLKLSSGPSTTSMKILEDDDGRYLLMVSASLVFASSIREVFLPAASSFCEEQGNRFEGTRDSAGALGVSVDCCSTISFWRG
jgi:hypothetical protein